MPKRVRPYGSATDAESAALSRGRGRFVTEPSRMITAREIANQAAEAAHALNDLACDAADVASLDDVRDVIAGLERMGQDLPHLYEQLARIVVVQREDGQIARRPGADPDLWVVEVVEALAAAGQAADMMTAALTQASRTSAELRSSR